MTQPQRFVFTFGFLVLFWLLLTLCKLIDKARVLCMFQDFKLLIGRNFWFGLGNKPMCFLIFPHFAPFQFFINYLPLVHFPKFNAFRNLVLICSSSKVKLASHVIGRTLSPLLIWYRILGNNIAPKCHSDWALLQKLLTKLNML